MMVKNKNKLNHTKYNLCDNFYCKNKKHIYFHKKETW